MNAIPTKTDAYTIHSFRVLRRDTEIWEIALEKTKEPGRIRTVSVHAADNLNERLMVFALN